MTKLGSILDCVGKRLSFVAIGLLIAYILYNELFRSTPTGDELKQAQQDISHVQTEVRYVSKQLVIANGNYMTLESKFSGFDGELQQLNEKIAALRQEYDTATAKRKLEIAVLMDRYQKQKAAIQDIQNQIK